MTVDSLNNPSKGMKNPISYFWNKIEFYSLFPRLNRLKYIALNSFWVSIFILLSMIGQELNLPPLAMGLIIFFILPNFLALKIRRLNDSNRSGWWILLNVIPVLGNIIAFVLLWFWPGTKGANCYGERQPKADMFYYLLTLSMPLVFALMVFIEFFKILKN